MKGPAGFAIQPQRRERVIRGAPYQRVSDVIGSVSQRARNANRELVAQVRAQVSVAEFELQLLIAIRQRQSKHVVARVEILLLFEIEASDGGAVKIELETFWVYRVGVAKFYEAGSAAERGIGKRAALAIGKRHDSHPRLVRACQVRMIDQAGGHPLPTPAVVVAIVQRFTRRRLIDAEDVIGRVVG